MCYIETSLSFGLNQNQYYENPTQYIGERNEKGSFWSKEYPKNHFNDLYLFMVSFTSFVLM
jgi:hypothetical protein